MYDICCASNVRFVFESFGLDFLFHPMFSLPDAPKLAPKAQKPRWSKAALKRAEKQARRTLPRRACRRGSIHDVRQARQTA